ncbi:hypothetical protein CRE_10576 [Caenorhabditis remanei]|uniref:F-box domain-containing protein n=1 Tax=Caenorhabditis remanei TaxID=31234 RepID=E3N783_CAERE|nr:hypothetical protein CRE_10576 [Caenorhabditis remanei]
MKFLTFPTLILKDIFENLTLEQLLILSLCSKRTTYAIQAIQSRQLKKVEYIFYKLTSEDQIIVRSNWETFNVKLSTVSLKDNNIIPTELFGMKREVECCSPPSKLAPRYIYIKKDREMIMEKIHDYFYQIFGSTVYYQLESYADGFTPRLKNINCSDIILPNGTSLFDLKTFFNSSPNQEYVRIRGDLNGKLTKNSALFTTEYLDINSSKTHGDDILLAFKGISIRFQDTMFHASTIIWFLNAWKSGKGFHNLKFVSIASIPGRCLDKNKLAENVGIKSLGSPDDTFEVKWIERTNGAVDGNRNWRDRSFNPNQYLIRDNDGEVAFIRVTMFSFDFAVWSALGNPEVIDYIDMYN